MISRLRPGCLRWQHSENADGRGQLEGKSKTENMPLCEKKGGRETKEVKERESARETPVREKRRGRKKIRWKEKKAPDKRR